MTKTTELRQQQLAARARAAIRTNLRPRGAHVLVDVFVGPPGSGAIAGTLTLRPSEALDLAAALRARAPMLELLTAEGCSCDDEGGALQTPRDDPDACLAHRAELVVNGRDLTEEERAVLRSAPVGDLSDPTEAHLLTAIELCRETAAEWSDRARGEAEGLVYLARVRARRLRRPASTER